MICPDRLRLRWKLDWPGLAAPIQDRFLLLKGPRPPSAWLAFLFVRSSERDRRSSKWNGLDCLRRSRSALYYPRNPATPKAWQFCFSVRFPERARDAARKTKPSDKSEGFLLPDLDSNQDKQNQNLRYYRYTIGQSRFCY